MNTITSLEELVVSAKKLEAADLLAQVKETQKQVDKALAGRRLYAGKDRIVSLLAELKK